MLKRAGIVVPAVQYILAMLIAMVPMPLQTGLHLVVALFVTGVGILISHFTSNGKAAVFFASGFALISVISIVNQKFAALEHITIAVLVAGVVSIIPVMPAMLFRKEKIKVLLEKYLII